MEIENYINQITSSNISHSFSMSDIDILMKILWVSCESSTADKSTMYVFREKHELFISRNGSTEKGKWENIGSNSVVIQIKNEIYLLRLCFFDNDLLILRGEGIKDLKFLINEDRYNEGIQTVEQGLTLLEEKYRLNIARDPAKTICANERQRPVGQKEFKYIVVDEKKIRARQPFIKITLFFPDSKYGQLFINLRNRKSYFIKKTKGVQIPYKIWYKDFDRCLNGLHHYLTTGAINRDGLLNRPGLWKHRK